MIEDFDVLSLTKQEKHLLYKKGIEALRSIKYLHLAQTPKDSIQRNSAFINTIKKHSLENVLSGYYLRGAFYELSKYDKINTYKNQSYLIKLDRLFFYLKEHMAIIEEINSSSSFATLNTTYSNHGNFIQPIINAYKITNEDNMTNNTKLNILNEYKKDPFLLSMCIQSSKNKNYSFLYENNLHSHFQDLSKRIFSYKLKLSKEDIAKSLQAHLICIYRNNSIFNQLMKNIKPISNVDLINYITNITRSFLYANASSFNVKNINSQMSNIDYINNLPILKLTTTKLKEEKINSYEDFLLKLS